MSRLLAHLLPLAFLISGCAAATPNFAVLDSVMVDQNTSLVWAKNADMAKQQLPWRSENNAYEFIRKLNDSRFAGYADWRLPTRDEFSVLIDYARSAGYDRNDMKSWPYRRLQELGFADVRDYGYWTASRNSATEMWTADLQSGDITPAPENLPYYVWPVRGRSR